MSADGLYETWLVIESEDNALTTILGGLGIRGTTDSSERPQICLEQRDQVAVLSLSEPDAFFKYLRDEKLKQRSVHAISLAPSSQVKFFDRKVFYYVGGHYRVRRAVGLAASPYSSRFLEFEFVRPGVQEDLDIQGTAVKEVANPSGPPVWLDPQHVELSEFQVNNLFHPTNGSVVSLTAAFFLPPVRTIEDPQRKQSYFREQLVTIHKKMASFTAQPRDPANSGTPPREEVVNVILTRLLDDPLLRDIFLDGGAIRVRGEEGDPTSVLLELCGSGGPAAAYRARTILEPDSLSGPAWGRELAHVVRGDVESLIPGGLPIADSVSASPVRWHIPCLRDRRNSGARVGMWDKLLDLRDRLGVSTVEAKDFDELILQPSRGLADPDSFPDHDLAENLFIANAWRCPWTDDPDDKAWRHAMLQVLRDDELAGHYPTPEERIDAWNEATRSEGRRSFSSRRQKDGVLVLRYSGMPDAKKVLQWRLLLPLGTIVNARTLYLDVSGRSRLDSGFVLA